MTRYHTKRAASGCPLCMMLPLLFAAACGEPASRLGAEGKEKSTNFQ
ncbi:MAG: hypothetical protein RR332_01450 [Clostridiales bacterium]